MLILFGKVDKVKVALQLVGPASLHCSLETHKCYILVLLHLATLLRLLATLDNRVMLPIFDGRVDHLVVELVWVSLPSLFTQFLDDSLFRVVVLRATLVVTLLLQET